MKPVFFLLMIVCLITACNPADNSGAGVSGLQDMHKVEVKEVLQTANYTYLRVTEKDIENWLALPRMNARAGDIYYYRNGFKMTDFESRELGKTFKTVYFLESISQSPDLVTNDPAENPHSPVAQLPDSSSKVQYRAAVKVEKEEVKTEKADQGITIAELYANKENYSGKTVRIRGKVTKFNDAILKRNWIHIQDGTEFAGKFDLTATTTDKAVVGGSVILEGRISLNKDFGYGYAYEVLMEDAVLLEK